MAALKRDARLSVALMLVSPYFKYSASFSRSLRHDVRCRLIEHREAHGGKARAQRKDGAVG